MGGNEDGLKQFQDIVKASPKSIFSSDQKFPWYMASDQKILYFTLKILDFYDFKSYELKNILIFFKLSIYLYDC